VRSNDGVLALTEPREPNLDPPAFGRELERVGQEIADRQWIRSTTLDGPAGARLAGLSSTMTGLRPLGVPDVPMQPPLAVHLLSHDHELHDRRAATDGESGLTDLEAGVASQLEVERALEF
jgi:hypothetical protein